MHISFNFLTPPITVIFICSCDNENVDHKQKTCFPLTRTF